MLPIHCSETIEEAGHGADGGEGEAEAPNRHKGHHMCRTNVERHSVPATTFTMFGPLS
jgi:hypothetical protein